MSGCKPGHLFGLNTAHGFRVMVKTDKVLMGLTTLLQRVFNIVFV